METATAAATSQGAEELSAWRTSDMTAPDAEGTTAEEGEKQPPCGHPPTLHDRLAAERHVPRPVPSLGIEDAASLDQSAVEAAAGLAHEEAERLRREAQDEVLAELKGEVFERRAAAAQGAAGGGGPSDSDGTRRHSHSHSQRRRRQGSGEGGPELIPDGALAKFARAAARERHQSARTLLEALPAARVDLDRLDSKE